MRQLLTESLVLAFVGAALGLLLAGFGSDLLVTMITARRGELILDVTPDARVLAFALALATATALLFGMVPALRSASVDAQEFEEFSASNGQFLSAVPPQAIRQENIVSLEACARR